MNVYSAILRRRSIRRFRKQPISDSTMNKLVDAARLAPSANNFQPLEYITVNEAELCEQIFPHLMWAAFIDGGDAPPEGKRPTGYLVVLINRKIREKGGTHDVGAAVQNILLAAFEEGLGSCWIRSVNRPEVAKILNVPDHFEIDTVISLGYPGEAPMTEPAQEDTKYWRDDRGVMHVPKRMVDQIVHRGRYGE